MGRKTTIVLICILSAFIIMSSGYGLWQEELIIEGSIKVIPDPKVLQSMQSELDELILQEELRLAEELRVAEEQQLLEVQKLLEEQRLLELLLNPIVEGEQVAPVDNIIEENATETEKPVNNETEQLNNDNDQVDVNFKEEEKEEIERPVATVDKVVEEKEAEVEKDNNNDDDNTTSIDNESESNKSVNEEVDINSEQGVIESND